MPKQRVHTWKTPWKIWWWFGYHGFYQINWLYTKQIKFKDLKFRDFFWVCVWYSAACFALTLIMKGLLNA